MSAITSDEEPLPSSPNTDQPASAQLNNRSPNETRAALELEQSPLKSTSAEDTDLAFDPRLPPAISPEARLFAAVSSIEQSSTETATPFELHSPVGNAGDTTTVASDSPSTTKPPKTKLFAREDSPVRESVDEDEGRIYNSPESNRATDEATMSTSECEITVPSISSVTSGDIPLIEVESDVAQQCVTHEEISQLQAEKREDRAPETGGEARRKSDQPERSVIDELKSVIGAQFRPPFTPSNSLLSPPPMKVKAGTTGRRDAPSVQSKRVYRTKPETNSPLVAKEKLKVGTTEDGMRSSSARPVNRQALNAQSSNGRASTSTVNGGSSRTPSVPPTSGRMVNKKYVNVKSRIDASSDYVPQRSSVKIFHQPVKFNVTPKIGSLQNATHVPGGGNLKIESRKLSYKEHARPKIEDKVSVEIPKNTKKIPTQKLQWNVTSKIGSLENASYKPTGGGVKIFHQPVKFDGVQGKVGSMDNATHVPGGGNVKIKEYTVPTPRQNGGSRSSMDHSRRSSTSAAK